MQTVDTHRKHSQGRNLLDIGLALKQAAPKTKPSMGYQLREAIHSLSAQASLIWVSVTFTMQSPN